MSKVTKILRDIPANVVYFQVSEDRFVGFAYSVLGSENITEAATQINAGVEFLTSSLEEVEGHTNPSSIEDISEIYLPEHLE